MKQSKSETVKLSNLLKYTKVEQKQSVYEKPISQKPKRNRNQT